MKMLNQMKLSFLSRSVNEAFARAAVSSFLLPLDPTVNQLSDVRTAVSEAVTNCIVHAYPDTTGIVYIDVKLTDTGKVIIRIRDKGVGIEDIPQAMEPLFSTSTDERAGLGFAVMQSFMDRVRVRSQKGKGTVVTLEKYIDAAHDQG